jgi:predicted nucleotidyltransferase component of viral defense system
LKSGSKKPPAAPPELTDWQVAAIDAVAQSKLAPEVVFGGGAALSAIHLHHRTSEDLDFFLVREVDAADVKPIAHELARNGVSVNAEAAGPRRSLILLREGAAFGKLDFSYYPFDPIDRRTAWRHLRVESLLDMTVNKLQALLTRFQARDFVDCYFLLREGPERDLDRLLEFVRAKFDVGADLLTVAQKFLRAREINELPHLLRNVSHEELVAFFEERAREIVRRG